MRCLFGFLWVSFALVVLLVPAQGAVAQTVYEEGAFDLGHWRNLGPFSTPEDDTFDGTPATGAETPSSGGYPGGYLRFSVTGVAVPIGSSTVAWAMLINDQAVYNPQDPSLGAIERIDFDLDARVPPEDRLQRVVSLAVEQDGHLWAAIVPRLFIQEKSWLPTWISGLQAEDFVASSWAEEGQPANPDFSSTASPIKFGILTGTSCPTTSNCSVRPVPKEVDIDNWRVAVNESDLSLRLSVAQVDGDGVLEDLDLEFRVSARVRNATSPDLDDVTVRFLLPKAELAGFTIPDGECVPDSASRNDFVIADCTVPGPIGPGSSETVEVPASGISVGYADVVPVASDEPDRAVFTYKAGVLPLAGTDPDPANDVADLVDVAVCNPSGMDPVTVEDIAACDDLMTGGTSGAGGAGGGAGTAGTDMSGSDGGGCSCDTATTSGSAPGLLILCLAGAALWLRRRHRHT
jgi:MYXO-CTERM domain-containing protein